jgi:hypothetical protein
MWRSIASNRAGNMYRKDNPDICRLKPQNSRIGRDHIISRAVNFPPSRHVR